MAKTFFKFQERDVDSQVNFADIGLGISGMITDQIATRQAKKDAYDDQTRALNDYLEQYPEGDDTRMTEWTMDYSTNMQAELLKNQRAFKNGMISERDNIVFAQNVQNGTKTMFDLSTEYQAEYKEKMARYTSTDPTNKSQELENFLTTTVEGYENFLEAKPIIDPKTGVVLMSKKNKDGSFETVSVNQLQKRIKSKYNYYDFDKKTTDIESATGEEVRAEYIEAKSRLKTGQIKSVEDKEIKDGFEKALTDRINAELVSSTVTSSILTNSILAKDYSFTFDKGEAASDDTKILLTIEPGGSSMPMPDFTTENGKKQLAVASNFMFEQVVSKIDRKEDIKVVGALGDAPPPPQPNAALIMNAQERQKVEDAMKNWSFNAANMIFGGDATTSSNATSYISSGFGNSGAVSITKKGNKITQIDANGNTKTFVMDGSRNAAASYVAASGIPQEYQDKAVNYLMGFKGDRNVNSYNSSVQATKVKETGYLDAPVPAKPEKPAINTSKY